MNVLLSILAVIFTLGMIGDKENDGRRNYTVGFVTCIVAMVIMSVIRG